MWNGSRFAVQKLSIADIREINSTLAPDRQLLPVIDYSRDRLVMILDRRTGDRAAVQGPPLPQSMRHEDAVKQMHRLADEQPEPGVAYFIGGDEGLIRIGVTLQLETRLKSIQSCSPIPLKVLATKPGGCLREAAYHCQFAEYRRHGEWFERHPDILAEIDRLNGEAV